MEAAQLNMTDSACCDEIAPARNQDTEPSPPADVVEIIALTDLVPEELPTRVWHESTRPPPQQVPIHGPVAPRAPPLS